MKISVVMTTYNGEKYIYDQINSIYEQTRKASEVIICDDCSGDKTAEIIQKFIKEHELDHWKLIVNAENKGWQRNFLDALGDTSGSYIFFSDQDDVWYKDKIEIMTDIMERHSEIQCISGKMTTIDKEGDVFRGRNAFSAGDGSGLLKKHEFSAAFNTITMLGCTMCITRKLADILMRIDVKDYGHDAQCCRLGILLDGAYTLDRPVIYYRLHDHNTSGVVSDVSFGSANLEKRKTDIHKNIVWLERLLKVSETENFLSCEKESLVRQTIKFQKMRSSFLTKKSLIKYIKLSRYKKFYSGISMYIGDFAYAFGINKLAGRLFWQIQNKRK